MDPRRGLVSTPVWGQMARRFTTAGRTATVHGFRASFRDWASEHAYPRGLAERALAHTIKDATEATYHRTDLLDQKRSMMDAWAKWLAA